MIVVTIRGESSSIVWGCAFTCVGPMSPLSVADVRKGWGRDSPRKSSAGPCTMLSIGPSSAALPGDAGRASALAVLSGH